MTLRRLTQRPLLVGLAVVAAAAISACGDSESGNGTDRAFVGDMVPHHGSAVDMAEIARQRGEHPEIKTLAANIIASQNKEIDQMNEAKNTLDQDGVKAAKLGVPMHMMGMGMDMDVLKTAKPFDREFIDMMIPHHQGAVRMARIEIDKGDSGELKKLAEDIVSAQAKEIKQMNDWRTKWYGEPSPAGGVPGQKS